jgi:hypothetical protein
MLDEAWKMMPEPMSNRILGAYLLLAHMFKRLSKKVAKFFKTESKLQIRAKTIEQLFRIPSTGVKSLYGYILIGDCDKVIPLDIFKLSN